MNAKELPIPPHYNRSNAGKWAYRTNQQNIFMEAVDWAKKHSISAAASDKTRIHLLGIDLQKDFCFPEGTLFVGGRSGTGAIEDSARTAEFIYRNMAYISEITVTLDSHLPFQIFFSSFWLDEDGNHVPPHTIILTEHIQKGKYHPNPAVAKWLCGGNYNWLMAQVEHYCAQLEKVGKYQLYLWPFHCEIGDEGHSLVGTIHEARMFHAFARNSRNLVEVKGLNPLTENYSVFSPEVLMRYDGHAFAQRNTKFLETITTSDVVIALGQAGSHCVKSTLEDLLNEINAKDPSLCKKVYIVEDCMSAVTVPDGKGGFYVDFTDQQTKALNDFRDAGMHVVKSTDPIESWPDIKL